MTETETIQEEEITKASIIEKFQIQNVRMFFRTLIFSILGAILYAGVLIIPMPFIMVSILKFGLLPAVVIIALVGAFRGPIAGFLAGYLGELLYGLIVYNVIATMTLLAMTYGVLGFIVGLATYDFTNGRSLLKLSILAVVGFVFTVLLGVVIGMTIEGYSTLAAIGFNMVPKLTMGIPTLLLLTPAAAWVLYRIDNKFAPTESDE